MDLIGVAVKGLYALIPLWVHKRLGYKPVWLFVLKRLSYQTIRWGEHKC